MPEHDTPPQAPGARAVIVLEPAVDGFPADGCCFWEPEESDAMEARQDRDRALMRLVSAMEAPPHG